MKSLQFSSFGDAADVVDLVEIDEPAETGVGEVLAAIEYAPINASELLMIRGLYGVRPALPAPLGQEGVARIIAIGSGVSHLAVGDRVIVPLGVPVWRERVRLWAEELVPVPADADPQQLSMIHANPPTAGILLHEYGDVKPGDWIIQNAGNSGVGRNVIAFAREAGIRTVSLVRRESLVAELEAAGGDVVLVDGPGIAKMVADRTGNAKIRLAFDGIAGDATLSLTSCLAPGGTAVFYAGMSGKPGAANPIHLIFNDITISGFWLGSNRWRNAPAVADYKAAAIRLIAEAKLHVPVVATYPLTRAKEAIAHAQAGGKVLFRPDAE